MSTTTTKTWTVPRYIIEDVLTEANIDGEDGTIRDSYEGRGPTTPGFGVVLRHTRDLARVMFGLGAFAGVADEQDDEERWSALYQMEKVVSVDTMGLGFIVYFPGVSLAEDAES